MLSQNKKQISLEDIWITYKFYPQYVYGLKPMNDGEHYSILSVNKSIDKYSYKTGKKKETIFSLSEINDEKKPLSIDEYEFSNDETKILFYNNKEKKYRHSFIADYYVWDINAKKLTYLSHNGKQLLASFSPDGEKLMRVTSSE